MENRAHALAAGIFVLLLGLASTLALFWLGDNRSERSNEYLIETRRDVTGLNVAAKVVYRGIRAGKVEGIDTDEKDPRIILIRITLDKKYRVTRNTVAQMGYQGLTGLAFIKLDDDGSNNELLAGRDGEPPRIGMKPSLLETLGEKGGDMAAQLAEMVTRVSTLLNEKNIQNISRTIDNAAIASDGLKQMPQLMASMREVLSPANIRHLNSLLANVEKTAGEAAPLAVEVRGMVKSMTSLSQRLDEVSGKAGRETVPRVNALLRDLDTSTLQLSRILGMLDESPQALIFGRGQVAPGPGEAGFVAPAAKQP